MFAQLFGSYATEIRRNWWAVKHVFPIQHSVDRGEWRVMMMALLARRRRRLSSLSPLTFNLKSFENMGLAMRKNGFSQSWWKAESHQKDGRVRTHANGWHWRKETWHVLRNVVRSCELDCAPARGYVFTLNQIKHYVSGSFQGWLEWFSSLGNISLVLYFFALKGEHWVYRKTSPIFSFCCV